MNKKAYFCIRIIIGFLVLSLYGHMRYEARTLYALSPRSFYEKTAAEENALFVNAYNLIQKLNQEGFTLEAITTLFDEVFPLPREPLKDITMIGLLHRPALLDAHLTVLLEELKKKNIKTVGLEIAHLCYETIKNSPEIKRSYWGYLVQELQKAGYRVVFLEQQPLEGFMSAVAYLNTEICLCLHKMRKNTIKYGRPLDNTTGPWTETIVLNTYKHKIRQILSVAEEYQEAYNFTRLFFSQKIFNAETSDDLYERTLYLLEMIEAFYDVIATCRSFVFLSTAARERVDCIIAGGYHVLQAAACVGHTHAVFLDPSGSNTVQEIEGNTKKCLFTLEQFMEHFYNKKKNGKPVSPVMGHPDSLRLKMSLEKNLAALFEKSEEKTYEAILHAAQTILQGDAHAISA